MLPVPGTVVKDGGNIFFQLILYFLKNLPKNDQIWNTLILWLFSSYLFFTFFYRPYFVILGHITARTSRYLSVLTASNQVKIQQRLFYDDSRIFCLETEALWSQSKAVFFQQIQVANFVQIRPDPDADPKHWFSDNSSLLCICTCCILGRSTPATVALGGRAPAVCPALLKRRIGYSLKMKQGRRGKQRWGGDI